MMGLIYKEKSIAGHRIIPYTVKQLEHLKVEMDVTMENFSDVCEMCKHHEDCAKNHNSCTGFSEFEPE